jgi:hypothetical protein
MVNGRQTMDDGRRAPVASRSLNPYAHLAAGQAFAESDNRWYNADSSSREAEGR